MKDTMLLAGERVGNQLANIIWEVPLLTYVFRTCVCNKKQMMQYVLLKSLGLEKCQCDDDSSVAESLNEKMDGIEIRQTCTLFSRHETQ